MLASTPESTIQLRLPAGAAGISSISITIYISDTLNCVAQFNMSSVNVVPDLEATNTLIDVLQQSSVTDINSNPVIQLLASGNQNTIGQVLTSVSQVLNGLNQQSVEAAVGCKYVNFFFENNRLKCFFFLRWSSGFKYFCLTIRKYFFIKRKSHVYCFRIHQIIVFL